MDTINFTTKLLGIKDLNIKIDDIIEFDTHREVLAHLDYDAPECPTCGASMGKYDFQKASQIPYLDLCWLQGEDSPQKALVQVPSLHENDGR